MKHAIVVAFGFALASAAGLAGAQDKSADTLPPVQPPPAMDDAGAPATTSSAPVVPLANSAQEEAAHAAAEARASAERAKALANPQVTTVPPPARPLQSPGLPPDVQKAAEATELPVVTVRQNGNERVEEYRKKGILYFVRVVPQEGPTRYYVDRRSDIPPDIKQLSAPSGVIQPVYYKLAEWK